MFPSKRILIAGGALAAAAGIAATPVLAQDASTDQTQQPPAAEAPPADQGNRPSPEEREARRAEMQEALAAKLGISVDELSSATESAHQTVVDTYGEPERPTPNPDATDEERQAEHEARHAEMEQRHELFQQTLADNLGISVDELTAARQAVATDKVNEKLASGEITQEQADAALERIASGELRGPGGPGGPRGPHGPEGENGPPADAPAPDAPAADAGS